jgi:hypothetical protein
VSNRGHQWVECARNALARHAIELWIAAIVGLSCAYFFQGGGWNQNAHFATTVALVEDGTVYVDRYRRSTGDLARADGHVTSNKPVATALLAVPAYVVARIVTAPVTNHGNRVILRAHLTALGTSGFALALLAVLLYQLLRRYHGETDAALVALTVTLATPLFPNSTMLNSHALTSLAGFAAFSVLDAPRHTGGVLSTRRLLAAGALAASAMALEYMTAILVVPLAGYAVWQTGRRWRLLAFVAGAALVALVPLLHHTWVYGHPLHTGYHSLVVPGLARHASIGFMGFVGLSPRRLFELTFGGSRGFFHLSPVLLAALPGWVLLLRQHRTRPEGLLTAVAAWGVLLAVASLVYWHSGSALGSRYALPFVPFSALAVAAVLPRFRLPVAAATGIAFSLMVLATSVTATPPTPPARPPYPNVIAWLWERFSKGDLASWRSAPLLEEGVGHGDPTLPFAYNLGQLLGLQEWWSLAPYFLLLAALITGLVRELRAR